MPMQLNKDADKLSEHMAEAKKRADAFCTKMELDALADARRKLHKLSDEAWDAGDVIEHRIYSMAANEAVGRWQEVRQAHIERKRKG
jgi:hypothetical protein